ncbi:MAG: hypothetical protein JW891_05300 [Candidatus Lokiarchaeota archaeon]|nr:hypothetical protein [Candidatus Lokiarchaeota archaeon]
MSSRSEDTLIFYALTPGYSPKQLNFIYNALEDFCAKKKELDRSDRFNVVLFQEDGPNYLQDFTLNPDNVLIALKSLEPMIVKANVSGGIMVAVTFIIDVYKKIPDKCFRIIVLTDDSTHEIPDIYVPVLENIIDKVKDMPLFLDVVRIQNKNSNKDGKLLDLARMTRGTMHEVNNLTELTRVFDILHHKKSFSSYSLINDGYETEIPYENFAFYRNLAENPIELRQKETCSVCFKKDKNHLVKCPSCETIAHKSCWSQWARTSNIGIFNVFRCHNCFLLIKIEEEFVQMVLSGAMPSIEEVEIEVVDLHEYEESLETKEGPKIVQVEDPMAIFYRHNDDDIVVVKDDD